MKNEAVKYYQTTTGKTHIVMTLDEDGVYCGTSHGRVSVHGRTSFDTITCKKCRETHKKDGAAWAALHAKFNK